MISVFTDLHKAAYRAPAGSKQSETTMCSNAPVGCACSVALSAGSGPGAARVLPPRPAPEHLVRECRGRSLMRFGGASVRKPWSVPYYF